MSKYLNWVRAAEGRYPGKAVVGGRDSEQTVFVIFVGRATHKGHFIPGKIFPPHRCMYIASDGKEISLENYEALEFDPPRDVDAKLEWIPARDGNTPKDAVPGGTETGGRLYIGRCRYEGQVLCGKVSPQKQLCSVAWKGKELTFRDYEVLVLREVKRYLLTELWYNTEAATTEEEDTEPQVLVSKKIVNRSNLPQSATLKLSYKTELTKNWGHISGFTLGVETEIQTAVPLPTDDHFESSPEVAYVIHWGSSYVKSQVEEEVAQCTVPPKSSMVVKMLGKRLRVDMPYTGKLVRVFTNGKRDDAKPISANYRSIEITDLCLEYSAAEPLNLDIIQQSQ